MKHRIKFLLLFSLFSIAVTACSGLAGEPRIVATLPPPTPPQSEPVSQTIEMVDLELGAQSYAENCTRCHGTTGAGDGELALAGQLPVTPPDFTNYEVTRNKTPREWFDAITNGNLEALMPPWNRLSQNERWALTYYLYTLAYQPDQLEQGAAVWQAECADCHGITGEGDGPSAANISVPIPDLTTLNNVITVSDAELYSTVTSGVGEAMPAFGDTLTDAERLAVVAYTRMLVTEGIGSTVVEQVEIPEPAATEDVNAEATQSVGTTASEATQEPGTATTIAVTGTIINGTEGFDVPDDLVVGLLILDGAFNEQGSYETTVNADGNFMIEDVPLYADFGYVTTVNYDAKLFFSPLVSGSTATDTLDLSVTIYEVTDDPEAVYINNALTQISVVEGGLQVIEIVNFVNRTDRLYSQLDAVGENVYPSTSIVMPEGARLIDFGDTSQLYVVGDDGVTVSDTRPLLPDQSRRMHLAYFLPASGSISVEQPIIYEIEGEVTLLVDSEITIESDQFPYIGPQTMGNTVFEGYNNTLSLSPGDTISYNISFTPQASSSSSSASSTSNTANTSNALPVALIFVGVVAIVIAVFLYMRDNSQPEPSASNSQQLIDGLIQQIAELDEQHQNGEIDQEEYELLRGKFKARLKDLMKGSDS